MRFLSIPVGLTSIDWPDYTIYYTASITKSARETPSVHHVGLPAKR